MYDTREERELRLQEAMAAWKRGDFPSIRSAAMFHKMPFATLTHRINGRVPRLERQKQPTLQLLTDAQEAALADWCRDLFVWGHPVRYDLHNNMASTIAGRKVGIKCYERYLDRH